MVTGKVLTLAKTLHEVWGHPLQEVQDFVHLAAVFFHSFPPESGTVQQSSRWSHWHPALRARDAILVDHRGSCQGHKWIGPTMRVLHGRCICKLQVWHLQVRCPLLIILESRHICSRAAEFD